RRFKRIAWSLPMSVRQLLTFTLLLGLSAPLWAAKRVDLDYRVRFVPESDLAKVRLTLEKGEVVQRLPFNLGNEGYYSDFATEGSWTEDSPQSGTWQPAKGRSRLSYKVRISHPRGNDRFDARMTADWALLRGDDLIPSAHMVKDDGVELVARVQFELPKGWSGIETGWPRVGENRFRIDNPSRQFDRPTGWILAGKIGSRDRKSTRLNSSHV